MIMAACNSATARSLTKYAAAGVCAILLSACATAGQKGELPADVANYKDAVGVFTNPSADPNGLDPIAAAASWGARYDKEPTNVEAAVRYSSALRRIGSVDEAVMVATKAQNLHPDNADINLELGKALVENGRAFEAVRYLETAVENKSDDWRALSAYGVALDQIGEHSAARGKYDEALRIAPNAVSVQSNKGLSFAMSGDLDRAVAVLRAAAGNRGSTARVRQNLALVLAIKGDYAEAVRLARSDLPPQLAEQNAAYFRTLLNQPAYWQQIAGDSVDAPAFDAAPVTPGKAEPAPLLKEEPKQEEKQENGKPMALTEPATPVTNASAVVNGDEFAAPDLKKN
jgi:Flp pilus assembly protein TadD